MSHQVLARKWRPRSFRELVGQQHVLQALVNALDHDRLHHAYLFTGTRGVGKTTIARILAKCLNCEVGVSSVPCGQCSACNEVNEGRFVDLIEVDAASRTKVEDTRELLENVQYAPTRGRYKVYLIDEVHMLSSHSFNALLKTLEEPPPHVKFLLATTDPQKLPITILSRCLQFHLKNMDPERIVGHLQHVLEKEMVPFEESALWQIGRSADGSMRDALSLTDQAIAFGAGKIADADVSSMLGSIDPKLIYTLLQALTSGEGKQVLASVQNLSEHAPDYSSALAEMLSVLHRVAIGQALPEAVDNSRGDRDQVLQLSQTISAEDVQLFYQTALLGRRDLPMSPDPRAGFEMVLLRMLAFRPQGVHSIPTQALPASQSAPSVQASPDLSASATDAVTATSQKTNNAEVNVGAPEESVLNSAPVAEPIPEQKPVSTPANERESGLPGPKRLGQEDSEPDAQTAAHAQRPPWEDAPEKKPEAVAVATEQPASRAQSDANEVKTSKKGLPAELMASMGLRSGSDISAPVRESKVPASGQNDAGQVVAEEVNAASLRNVSFEQLQPSHWIEVYAGLNVGGVLQSTVSNCQLVGKEPGHAQFILDEGNSTLYDDSHQQRLSDLLKDYFGEPIQAHIQLGTVTAETPATYLIRLRKEQFDGALKALHADPVVQALIEQFDAVLDENSVKAVL